MAALRHTRCGNNVTAFFMDLWENLPSHIRLRGVRADSGFCLPELLALWKQLNQPYVVVARLNRPIQKIIQGDLLWTPTEVPGTEVAELEYQALVTSLPRATHSPLAVWRYYNGRADCENVIKEFRTGFALPTLCLKQFWATEAALSLASLTYNLTVLFQRQLDWQQKVTLRNLRFWLFVTAGVLSHPAGKTTLKLAVPQREREWWRRLWEKILSPFPQLQCSRKPTHFLPSILMNLRFQLHRFG